MNRLILIALLATGCGSVELGGLAVSDRLAIEHQRAYVATTFALAKPYELVSADGKADDYVGPIRQAATILNEDVTPPLPAEPPAAIEWLTWDAASQLSGVTTRPVLVFQHSGKPLKFTAETMAELNKLGILCSDSAAKWQPQAKKPIAPAVAYVAHDAALGSEPPFLADLKTDSESATLKQLKAWINAIEAH